MQKAGFFMTRLVRSLRLAHSHMEFWSIKIFNSHCLPLLIQKEYLLVEKQIRHIFDDMGLIMRKPAFCICENKGADQLRGNREADQRLRFRYTDMQSLFFLNPKIQASRHFLWLYSPVYVGPGWKSRRPVFSQRGSYLMKCFSSP